MLFLNSLKSLLNGCSRFKLTYAFMGLCALLTSGCSTFNSGFECDKVGGVKGCISMSEVHEQSQFGNTGSFVADKKGKNDKKGNAAHAVITHQTTSLVNNTLGTPVSSPLVGQPVRKGEKIQKITLFDYVDGDGNYHEPSIVYTILKGSQWINHSVSAVQSMGVE
ncbi:MULTISPECIES: type IV conjugative transfer system lipoprotein TraV [Cysteiniphilum]|uniref:type IV conjugative transfer system lipoprotein TraV n=1 Tax=Cysteiniphilum TaxID=2056696 RepID=UPI00177DE6DE|nr:MULTISPECIES: type IV conjugative transfer system lipoprotein TraV [Cysteiniphilum]